MEQIQYKEPDGTLVTVAGYRPTESRHYRESNAHGFLSFPALYFQNRNFGLVIRDGVPAGRQEIKIYGRVPNGKTLNGTDAINIQQDWGISVFRNQSFGGKYGWNDNNGLMVNASPKYKNHVFDPTRPYTNGQICASDNAIFDCERPAITAYVDNDIYWDGSKGEGRRALKIGDGIEISAANFLPPGAGQPASIDGAGTRYYSWEQLYVVGKGIVPWYGGKPALYSVPVPDDALSGGMASLNYQYAGQPHRIFQQVVNNIGFEDVQRFTDGRRIFHTSFIDGTHTEFPDKNPPLTQYANQVGKSFNAERCITCHTLNGRSMPVGIGNTINALAVLTGDITSTGVTPDPNYGMNVQQLSTGGATDKAVKVQSYEKTVRTLPDGEQVELQKPVYGFNGPTPAKYSVRQAPQIIGGGLLEAIDESTILQLADPNDKDGNGVRGIPNWATDPETGQRHLGRFGWKAGKGSLRHQTAAALLFDMGVVSPVYRSRACQQNVTSAECKNAQATGGVSEADLKKLTQYLELLGVPSQVSYKSNWRPSPDNSIDMPMTTEHDIDPVAIRRGSSLFAQAQCVACHVSQLKTGNNHPFAELRNQTIRPYTDLLLHDMGPGLSDTLTEGSAQPFMWRTQPLWGIGSLAWVQIDEQTVAKEDRYEDRYTPRPKKGDVTNARYLHDGRARSIKEAILWHDGEAAGSRKLFENLSRGDREALITFLKSL